MKCILASFLLLWFWLLLLSLFPNADSFHSVIVVPKTRSRRTLIQRPALEVDASSEVVGGHGRIGSLFLKEEGAISVPRGVAPGCLTSDENNSPIVVAIPPEEWRSILDMTLPHRRSDLVWVHNTSKQNLLRNWQRNATVVLLPDTILSQFKDGDQPTYVYGKHAAAMKTIMARKGLSKVVEMKSWADLCDLTGQTKIENIDIENSHRKEDTVVSVSIPAIDLVCTGERLSGSTQIDTIQSTIVVGGGIIGSSIAHALSSSQPRGIQNITVYDPTPVGTTTPASWAWLNANQKPPHAYKSLNQLGLRGWRSDPLLSTLSSLKWCGTLVQTNKELEWAGGYTVEGPLARERIQELEPEANFTTSSKTDDDNEDHEPYVYYFADEGHVDPQEAVLALRNEAMENGVSFISNERVVGLVRDNGRVVGVKRVREDGKETTQLADVVIVAAGANSSDKALSGVPLVHNPSKTYFASPTSSEAPILHRTLVDMVSSLYIAQRNDGTLVTGGGAVKFGLSSTSPSCKLRAEEVERQMEMVHELAQQLAPNPIENSRFTHKKEVISKPMPKDGFPILGYVEKGLYSAVTHSGMTLSPLIGQLVAAELKEQVSLHIMDDYRPSRFDEETGSHSIKDWQEAKSA